MPAVDSATILFIASVIEILTQLVKGLVPEKVRDWIPVVLAAVGLILGALFGVYYQKDLMAAVFEGLFGAATALGFYQVSSRLPAVEKAFGSRGWIRDT